MSSDEQQNAQPAKASARKPARRLGESDFTGKRLEYLKEELPRYLAKRAADGNKKHRRGSGDSVWDTIYPGFWKRFGWRLPFSEEPPDNPEEAAACARPPETPEEEEEMKNVVKWTETKIKSWYSRKKTALGPAKSVFRPWLEKLRVHEGPAPRRLMDQQFYMQDEAYHDKVYNEFHTRYPDATWRSRLALLNKVATDCLQEEPQEVKDAIKAGADRQHAADLEEYNESLDGLPSLDEAHQAEARERFSAVVMPLLDGLRAYTGYYIALIAGRVQFADTEGATDALDVTSLHAGVGPDTPAHLDFTKASPEEFDQFAKIFSRFVWNADHHKADARPPAGTQGEGTTATATATATTPSPNGGAPTPETAISTTLAASTSERGVTCANGDPSTPPTEALTTVPSIPSATAAASTTPVPESVTIPNNSHVPAPPTGTVDTVNGSNALRGGRLAGINDVEDPDARMEEDEVAVEMRDLRESYLHPPGPLLTAYLKTLDIYVLRKEVGRTSWFSPERLQQEEERLEKVATWRHVSKTSVATWGGADVAAASKGSKSGKGKSRAKRARDEDVEERTSEDNSANAEDAGR